MQVQLVEHALMPVVQLFCTHAAHPAAAASDAANAEKLAST